MLQSFDITTMRSIEYEFLIRRVYHCKRDATKGADALIYKEMERAHNNLKSNGMHSSNQTSSATYKKSFAAVRTHVMHAIVEGLQQIGSIIQPMEVEYFRKALSRMHADFFDRNELDDIIHHATNIFRKNGLRAQ